MPKQWDTEEQQQASKSISSAFGGQTKEPEPEDEENLWTKVKRWLESQFTGPAFGEKVSKEMKKK
jgi:hypothetical protein